jgi:hypothetical protein
MIGANIQNYIGRSQWQNADNVDFCGTMDDFYLFDVALTAAEIAEIQSETSELKKISAQQDVSIYPNPANRYEKIHIDAPFVSKENTFKLEIVNLQGQKVQTITLSGSPAVTTIKQSGIYLIQITAKDYKILAGKLTVK